VGRGVVADMKIAITGSTGLIGTALSRSLIADGHHVLPVVRRPVGPDDEAVRWDPIAGTIDADRLEGIDGIVHLAGAGIGDKRWTDEYKRTILESRTKGTDLIARTAAGLSTKPAVLVSASGINYYGDTGDTGVTEDAPPGDDFLADVCVRWEAATAPAADAGIRVATVRTGIVLTPQGGALAKLLPLFKLGLGGRMGSGRQWWSWISLDDEIAVIRHLLDHPLHGPVNATSPHPVTNAELTSVLGSVLHRPTVLPVPAFGPKLLLGGEAADALLFTSLKVLPAALSASTFSFTHPALEAGLRDLLDRPAGDS
jgi:uncharacterized protein